MTLHVLAAALAACIAVPAWAQPKTVRAVMHLGRYTLPTASRGLSDIVTSPIPVFGGIEKK